MTNPKPITLTQVDAVNYEGAGDPQPFVVVGDIPGAGGLDFPAGPVNDLPQTPTLTDLSDAQSQIELTRSTINSLLSTLRAVGVLPYV